MIQQARGSRVHERWAHLRFSVIGQLLAAPPAKGELKAAITALAARTWQHPTTGDPVQFGFATIERWYYRALKERADPVGVLRRKLRADAGRQVAIGDAVRQAVLAQYAAHKSWSVQLHHDNLVALAETRPELKPVPSYATLRRFMSHNGLAKRRRVTARRTDGAERAEARIADREVRSYEAEYVNGSVALGLPSRLAQGAHPAGRVGNAHPVRRARRQIAACLSPAMVSGRDRRGHRARAQPGVPEARPATRGAQRQRRRDDGRGDHRGLTRSGRPAPHHVALQPLSERQAGGVLGPGRGPADRHAGACAGPDLEVPERGHPGLGRARVQPQAPRRDRRGADLALPGRVPR